MSELERLKYNWSNNNITKLEANLLIELLIEENDNLYNQLDRASEPYSYLKYREDLD